MRDAFTSGPSFGAQSFLVTDWYEGTSAARSGPLEARTALGTVCYLPSERSA